MPTKPPGTLEEWRELSRRLRAEADEIDQAIAVLARKSGEAKEEPVEAPMFPSLTSNVSYATDSGMTSSSLAKHPGPVPGEGPATKLMKDLGLSSLAELATALGERHVTVRSWNSRDNGLPERVAPAVQKLRDRLRKSRSK
jgi:hypothetical protein